jgi:hypothetical protein
VEPSHEPRVEAFVVARSTGGLPIARHKLIDNTDTKKPDCCWHYPVE